MGFEGTSLTKDEQLCAVCLNNNCSEAIDHRPLPISRLTGLVESAKQHQDVVNPLKNKITALYSRIRQHFLERLTKDEQVFQEWVNQLYFCHLPDAVNKELLCQLSQKNYTSLPSKTVVRTVRILQK